MSVKPSRLVCRVQAGDQVEHVVRGRRRADLDADRVADPRREVDVRTVQLSGPLPHPDEVPGHVIRLLRPGVDAGQRLLVVQDEHLVTGVQVDPLERLRVHARRVHERHRPVDLAGHPLVALTGTRLADEVLVPGMHLA